MRATLIDQRGNRWVVEVAADRRERRRGLLGRDCLPAGHALLIKRARSIHTFGMRFAIVAAFLDGDLQVVCVRRMPPGRIALPRVRGRHVLECPEDADLRPGDRLVEANAGRPQVRGGRAMRVAPCVPARPPGGRTGGGSEDRTDEGQGAGGSNREPGDHHGEHERGEPPRPRRQSHRLSALAVGLHDPEVLKQRSHT